MVTIKRFAIKKAASIAAVAVLLLITSFAIFAATGGLELFLSRLGTAEEDRAFILLYQTQNDIEQALVLLDGIIDANVIISEERFALRPEHPLPRSIGVTLYITHEFPQEYDAAVRIAEMIRAMEPGVEVENIVIVNQYMNLIFRGGQ